MAASTFRGDDSTASPPATKASMLHFHLRYDAYWSKLNDHFTPLTNIIPDEKTEADFAKELNFLLAQCHQLLSLDLVFYPKLRKCDYWIKKCFASLILKKWPELEENARSFSEDCEKIDQTDHEYIVMKSYAYSLLEQALSQQNKLKEQAKIVYKKSRLNPDKTGKKLRFKTEINAERKLSKTLPEKKHSQIKSASPPDVSATLSEVLDTPFKVGDENTQIFQSLLSHELSYVPSEAKSDEEVTRMADMLSQIEKSSVEENYQNTFALCNQFQKEFNSVDISAISFYKAYALLKNKKPFSSSQNKEDEYKEAIVLIDKSIRYFLSDSVKSASADGQLVYSIFIPKAFFIKALLLIELKSDPSEVEDLLIAGINSDNREYICKVMPELGTTALHHLLKNVTSNPKNYSVTSQFEACLAARKAVKKGKNYFFTKDLPKAVEKGIEQFQKAIDLFSHAIYLEKTNGSLRTPIMASISSQLFFDRGLAHLHAHQKREALHDFSIAIYLCQYQIHSFITDETLLYLHTLQLMQYYWMRCLIFLEMRDHASAEKDLQCIKIVIIQKEADCLAFNECYHRINKFLKNNIILSAISACGELFTPEIFFKLSARDLLKFETLIDDLYIAAKKYFLQTSVSTEICIVSPPVVSLSAAEKEAMLGNTQSLGVTESGEESKAIKHKPSKKPAQPTSKLDKKLVRKAAAAHAAKQAEKIEADRAAKKRSIAEQRAKIAAELQAKKTLEEAAKKEEQRLKIAAKKSEQLTRKSTALAIKLQEEQEKREQEARQKGEAKRQAEEKKSQTRIAQKEKRTKKIVQGVLDELVDEVVRDNLSD